MRGRLYGVPGSHPTKAAELMLRQKAIPYTRLDLPPLLHNWLLRLLGFSEGTAPALRLDGRKVQRTRKIASVLDQVRPEPRLVPMEPAERAAVDERRKSGATRSSSPSRAHRVHGGRA